MARKKDEERKRGLPPIQLRAAEGVSNLMPASWGAPGGGLLSGGNLSGTLGLGGKVGVALLLSVLGAGAFGVGRMLTPRGIDGSVAAQSLAFDKPEAFRNGTSGARIPGDGAAGQSAMQVVPESLGGASEPQRAAESAKAAAAAKPPDAVEPLPASAAAAAVAAPPAADLSAEAKKNPFTEKFGQLSSFGAGHSQLNGGAGMSGGVGMQFAHAPLGDAKGFGATTAKATKHAQAAIAAASRPASHNRGFAYNQLTRSNGLSRQGAAASGETSSALASSAFSNSPMNGQALTGGGAIAAAPVTGAGAGTAGGPIAQNTQNANDGTSAPPNSSHSNSSPWKMIAVAGVAAMALGAVLLTIAQTMIQKGKKLGHKAHVELATPGMQSVGAADKAAAHALFMQGKMLAMIAAALGAASIGIGLAMWQAFHQKSYGAIFMAGGGVLVVLAMMALRNQEDDEDAGGQVDGTVNPKTDAAANDMQANSPHLSPSGPAAGPSGMPAASNPGVGSNIGEPNPSVAPKFYS